MTDKIESLKNNSKGEQPVDNSTLPVDKSPKLKGSKVVPRKKAAKKKGRGGARKGAGRPKGKMEARTLEKMAVKKQFEQRVANHADELFNAQVTVAKGTQYLFKREKIKTAKGYRWGKFEVVTDPEEMVKYLDGEFKDSTTKYFMLTAEKPDVHAIDSLLDRAFGRAPQNLNIKDDRPDPIVAILQRFDLLSEEEGDSDAGETTKTS